MRRWQPVVVAVILLALLGATLYATRIGWHGLSLEHKIDPVLLATLAVTLFIAYFLQYYLVSKSAADGSEKQILLDAIRDILAMLRELRNVLMACYDAGKISTTNKKQITRILRQVANSLETLETAIALSHCRKLQDECSGIRSALFDLKSSATGGSFPTRPYDVTAITDQDRTFRILNNKLHVLVFKITRT